MKLNWSSDGFTFNWAENDATAGGGAPPFSPSDISGLKVWVKSDQITGKNDGDTVTTWSDQSGNGYDFTEATHPPTYKVNIQNANAALLFNGTNQLLSGTSYMNAMSVSARTIFIVAQPITAAADSGVVYTNANFIGSGSGGDFGLTVAKYATVPKLVSYMFDSGDNAFKATTGQTISLATTYVIMQRHESALLYESINNGAETSTAATSQFSEVRALAMFGGGSSAFLNGYMMELIMYNVALNATQLGQVQTYLNTRWAVY